MGPLTEAMHFLHHRAGPESVEILNQFLRQHGLHRSLGGQSPTAGAEEPGERHPNLLRKLQGDELKQAEGDTAQHDEAFTRHPGLLHSGQMLGLWRFEGGILFGFARVARQILGSEAIGEGV
jgi:hypothetical protein